MKRALLEVADSLLAGLLQIPISTRVLGATSVNGLHTLLLEGDDLPVKTDGALMIGRLRGQGQKCGHLTTSACFESPDGQEQADPGALGTDWMEEVLREQINLLARLNKSHERMAASEGSHNDCAGGRIRQNAQTIVVLVNTLADLGDGGHKLIAVDGVR